MSRLVVNQIQGDAVSKEIEIPSGHKIIAADGGGIVIPGTPLQTQTAMYKSTMTVATTAVYTKITGLTVNITPKRDNSKFLLQAKVHVGSAYYALGFVFYRDGSEVSDAKHESAGNRRRAAFALGEYSGNDGHEDHNMSMVGVDYLDSPSGVTAGTQITYDIYGAPYSSGQPMRINRSAENSDDNARFSATSSFVVTEIAT